MVQHYEQCSTIMKHEFSIKQSLESMDLFLFSLYNGLVLRFLDLQRVSLNLEMFILKFFSWMV